jgi:hypothetical protein
MSFQPAALRRAATVVGAAGISVLLVVASGAQAQMPQDPQMPQAPQMQMGAPAPAQGSVGPSLKQVFAGTLAAVLQSTGVGVAGVLTQAIGGAITGWFNKPAARLNQAAAGAGTAPGMAPAAMGAASMPPGGMGDPSMGMGGMPPGPTGMPDPSMGMGGMAQSAPAGMPDPSMGMGGMAPPATTGMAGMAPPPGAMGDPSMGMGGMAPSSPTIYAGVAFEVHARMPGGSYTPVDPATHTFSTGERFVVHYRPSLPGQVMVMNVNPLGQEKQIDMVNVAAGELARLGPYEFRDNTGDETLRLILLPCRTDAMMASTRDIVRVEDDEAPLPGAAPMAAAPAAAPAGPLAGLSQCSAPGTRSVRPQTRDIAKVESEDGTMFALDQVSSQEIASGDLTPREITIAFRHR